MVSNVKGFTAFTAKPAEKKTSVAKNEFNQEIYASLSRVAEEMFKPKFDTSKTINRFNVREWSNFSIDLDCIWNHAFNEYVCFG
jgi:hypothetical protein